jgi:hypothetical protein
MSLNWNIKSVKDCKTTCYIGNEDDRTLNPTTETLIWATMIVGIGDLSQKNAEEFWFRLAIYEKLHGGLRRKWEGLNVEPVFFTAKDVQDHVGLHTNAGFQTRHAWMKHTLETVHRHYAREWKSMKETVPA